MAKNITQKSLFSSGPLVLPDGFYSGDRPNPNLGAFVEAHLRERPYNPVTDNYKVAAFNEPITTTKATAIYNMHTYSSKKPHDAIQRYIRHYTEPGDLVLDPMCGSGGTALAALAEKRKAIAIDRSPAAGYITGYSLRVFDCHDFSSAVAALRAQVEDRLAKRFSCSEPGLVKAVAYSETFKCIKCLKSVLLNDAHKGESLRFRGRTKVADHCPYCKEPIKTSGERLGFIPIELHIKKPGQKKQVVRKLTKNATDAHRFPVTPIASPKYLSVSFEGNIQPRLSKNLARAGAATVAELFSDANLHCLLEIESAVDSLRSISQAARSLLHLAVHAILYNCTRMYRHRAKGGFISGTYYIPHLSKCINPWESFLDKCTEIQRAIDEAQATPLTNLNCIVSVESAVSFCSSGHVPPNSIDYIFTDPPYGGTYHYGALNFLWEVWRKCDLAWRAEEITISEDGVLTFENWRARMLASMKECFDALKPGRWISLCFHGEVELWESINDIMAEVGFFSSQTEQAVFIDTDQKSYNQITGETSKKRDLVISYRKPKPGECRVAQVFIPADADVLTFRELARQIIREYLEAHPGSTKDRIYDELVSRMVRAGQMQAQNFEEILSEAAVEEQQPRMKNLFENEKPDLFGTHVVSRWYLKETADSSADEAESALEDAAARKLGRFIKDRLETDPTKEGVHYSDLFEQYVYTVKDRPRRQLDLLPDYFFKTLSGTWRLPATPEEEELKTRGRLAGTNRRVRRFLALLDAGTDIPEHLRPSPSDLAQWIRHCQRSGMYDEGRRLYLYGQGDWLARLSDDVAAGVEEDYQICLRALQRAAVQPGKKRDRKSGRKAKEQNEN